MERELGAQSSPEELTLFDVTPYIGEIALREEIDYDQVINGYGELDDPRSIARDGEW